MQQLSCAVLKIKQMILINIYISQTVDTFIESEKEQKWSQ